jgi:hypothetical protein
MSSAGIKERAWRCRITTMGVARVEGLEAGVAPGGGRTVPNPDTKG